MPIWGKTTVAKSELTHAIFYKFDLKKQAAIPWILLTTQTNLRKFTVVRRFSHKL